MTTNELLRAIPKVDELLASPELAEAAEGLAAAELTEAVRAELARLREGILEGCVAEPPERGELCRAIARRARELALPSLRPVINATGVILHTNLGRACMAESAARAAYEAACGYCTLEYNVAEGCRGSRHEHVESLLRRITGAEGAMAVNNNAGAVLLILSALGSGGEVVASRGELVEIGGSFRIPEIMVQCGCSLREVGATNKTHLRDYAAALGEQTRALLKVHTSNYRIVGFSESVPLAELTELAHSRGLPVIEDLGSGCLLDMSSCGLADEPTVQQSVRAGVDVISFSGDKLLGGPQAGIIVGKKTYIEALKRHPLARALRADKMTLAALERTLALYLDPRAAMREIPVLAMLAEPEHVLRERAEALCALVQGGRVRARAVRTEGQVGGGAAPTLYLPSWAAAVEVEGLTPDGLEERLRRREVPIIGRINAGEFLLDTRTLRDGDAERIAAALRETAGEA